MPRTDQKNQGQDPGDEQPDPAQEAPAPAAAPVATRRFKHPAADGSVIHHKSGKYVVKGGIVSLPPAVGADEMGLDAAEDAKK